MAKKLWGGRFKKRTDPLVEDFTKSIHYDYRLAPYDVAGSIVHVNILKESGLITKKEAGKLITALKSILNKIENGRFIIDCSSEDIHTHIQNEIAKKTGALSEKLHTARSRNDQVLFDTKLFCKVEMDALEGLAAMLSKALRKEAVKYKGIIVPGYTHLQHAQTVSLADYLNAYAIMLKEDSQRFKRVTDDIKLTFGSGALAGTPVAAKFYKRKTEIKVMGKKFIFQIDAPENALYTVSDRDFVLKALFALSVTAMHLSRFSEDLIIWSSNEFGFLELDDAFATGSSLMPQKKNPDVLELIRGSAGTVYGHLNSVLTMLKGLPLSYNRDMQLDKPALFDSIDIVKKELAVLEKLVPAIEWKKGAIEKMVADESLYATDMVYYLVKKGISFSKAHQIIGKLVKYSQDNNIKIRNMKDPEFIKISKDLIRKDIVKLMDPVKSVLSRISVDRSEKK